MRQHTQLVWPTHYPDKKRVFCILRRKASLSYLNGQTPSLHSSVLFHQNAMLQSQTRSVLSSDTFVSNTKPTSSASDQALAHQFKANTQTRSATCLPGILESQFSVAAVTGICLLCPVVCMYLDSRVKQYERERVKAELREEGLLCIKDRCDCKKQAGPEGSDESKVSSTEL